VRIRIAIVTAALGSASLAACGDMATLTVADGTGPAPRLPAPTTSVVPTMKIAPAVGWPAGAHPVPAEGLDVTMFADKLEHPRWLYVLPNGDVLVAETNAPPKPEDGRGVRGLIMKQTLSKAGAAVPSANRIILLRASKGDGRVDTRTVFIDGLRSPFGMALVGSDFYVADSDALVRFPYTPGETHIAASPVKVVDLPAGPINHHWTKNVIASADGTKLYVTVGSNSNVGENGIDQETGRAAIWEIDARSGGHRIFASGLRNPVGMAWEPESRKLWTAVNERDELGSDLVPDYMTSVRDGGFYGWPYSYYGAHVDTRVAPQRPELVATAIVPDYGLGPHTASLGLTSALGEKLGPRFADGMFVGQHGSWNRNPLSGYKVIFVPFTGARPSGMPVDVLTGFVDADGQAMGRPVGVAIDKQGALLVADDVGNTIWRVTASAGRPNSAAR